MQNKTLCFLTRGNPPEEVLLGFKKAGFGAGKYAGFGGGVEIDETVEAAAVRELEEETSIKISVDEIAKVGQLTFLFPSKPAWSQVVHVYLAASWSGIPIESDEMRPFWCKIDEIPLESMWSDAAYWLPLILKGRKIRATFVFKDDNESVNDYSLEDWLPEKSGRGGFQVL
jgi:8-oxo-dGTP pyrophosphatase MutT (NUDIX family)